MWLPKPRTLFIALSNLAIAIYLVKWDSEYQDICLSLLPSLIAVIDLRPIFVIQMMFIEFSLLPDFKSPAFCILSVAHLILWKLYFNSTWTLESKYSGESKITKYNSSFLKKLNQYQETIEALLGAFILIFIFLGFISGWSAEILVLHKLFCFTGLVFCLIVGSIILKETTSFDAPPTFAIIVKSKEY